MDITAAAWSWREAFRIVAPSNNYCFPTVFSPQNHTLSSPIRPYPFRQIPTTSCVVHSKKRNARSEAVLKPSIVDEVLPDDEDDDLLFDEFEDEGLVEDNNFFEDEYSVEGAELSVGDGEGGGGISLARLAWDKEALAIAKEVALSFNGELQLYAFRTLLNSTIRVRIERLTNKSGSPSMADIEAFTLAYKKRLDDAKSIPDVALEVSSPGVERVVRVPEELDRFKERPMYVRYVSKVAETGSSIESDGVFRLVSLDMETKCCIWGLADVKVNRGKAGKGRPLSKKQQEWRVNTPFDSLRLVRFHPLDF
ncbi:hypothetical protein RHSIM_Rhsim10G0083200 [Rhododendron simsii]|uniref:DUF7912 domain-containing protein n=1 Tax=Rhododendron simsii TaxID=118357 RepID=A0A834GEV1_RHOSS|nr:hypothetical protein RHSIM_Rhsim10G0083200 [Rhododendron simsii]